MNQQVPKELQEFKVAAVVVTYNRKNLLRKCLQALLRQTRPLDEIIVIDNASTDGTDQMVPAEFPQVTYIRLPENTGGAGGFYEGMKLAYEKGYDWIWVMDDDVYPDATCLENLLQRANGDKVLVPLRLEDGTGQVVEVAALRYDLTNPFLKDPRRENVARVFSTEASIPPTLTIEDFSFEGPLFGREIVATVGFPIKEFFIHGDDTEYALRIRRAGYQICLIKAAKIYKVALPRRSVVKWRLYYTYRNIFFIHMKYGANFWVKVKPFVWCALAVLKNLLSLRPNRVRIIMRALFDAQRMKPNIVWPISQNKREEESGKHVAH